MVDTFRPLELGEAGLAVEDPAYAWTWAGRGPDGPTCRDLRHGCRVPTYIAFLRAVNVGKRAYPMAELRAALTAAGFDGRRDPHPDRQRALPHAAALARRRSSSALEEAMLADRGFEVPVVLLTPAELVEVHDEALRARSRAAS